MKPIGLAAAAFLIATAVRAGDRFPELTPDRMSPEQRKVAEEIIAGPRKELSRLFDIWLRSPGLTDPLQKVGAHIVFDTSLPPRLNELAILITAREWTSQFMWHAHHPLALKAGVSPQVAADIAAGRRPADMQEDERIVYDFCMQLRRDRKVSDDTFRAAVATLGEKGVIDLIGVNGYYDLVSMTLITAELPLPPGVTPPLPPLSR